MSKIETVLCYPVRTAIGTYGGSLKEVPAPDLGATVIRETLKRSGLAADKVQTLVMGNVIQAGVKMNPARQAGIGAGLPVEVPALTVNRVCGSGAQGVVSAALEIWSGMIDCAIAGGMENMDRRAVPDAAGPLGRAHGRRHDVRQHAVRRPERRLQRQAFRLAHRRPGDAEQDYPRRPGPLGPALAAALCRRAGGRQVRRPRLLPWRCLAARVRWCLTRMSTTAPIRRPSRWRSSSRRFARKGPSRPAARRA